MNPAQLLAYFEPMAEAPDAIPRLRRFILDLAVRGKLVPQDPKDEPAGDLLKRIGAERAQLLSSKGLKKEKAPPAVVDEGPFGVPVTWCWTRLGAVTSYMQRGKSPKYAVADGSLVVSQRCIQWSGLDLGAAKKITLGSLADYEDIRFIRDNDLLWNSTGTGTIGRVVRVVDPPEKLVCDSHVTIVRCLIVDPEYIRTWLRSDHVYGIIEERAAGSTNQVELTAQMALSQVVPLPPLAEQRRIVARVDELMALCDRLEAARAERETRRDRLTAANVARLNTPDPDSFKDDARFALEVLPALTTRPDQVKQLRQTILNLAVRGKLVPQDSSDGHASELLKCTIEKKVRLLKIGVIPRSHEALADPRWVVRHLPASWLSITLGQVSNFITSGSRGWAEFYAQTGPSFIRAQNIRFGRLNADELVRVNPPVNAEGSRTRVESGDVLVVITGAGVTNPAMVERDLGEAYVSQHVGLVKPTETSLSPWLLLCLMADSGGRAELLQRAYGAGRPGLNLDNLRCLSIPLPPLAEQHRIVAKTDELMGICDRLEASLSAGEQRRSGLLTAILADALRPAEERDEAA